MNAVLEIKMPKSCAVCDFRHRKNCNARGSWQCWIIHEKIEVYTESRHPQCPLKKLNEEGDVKTELNLIQRVGCVLDLIEGELGEWLPVEPSYCPDNLQVLKQAQAELKELFHDLEVSNVQG